MPHVTITYTRKMSFHAVVDVSDAIAERLLKLNGENSISEGSKIAWDDEGCTDDFTLIAKDLSDDGDIDDGDSEIEDFTCIKN